MMVGGKILLDSSKHFAYARLKAIEQRKAIVRSANTGISGVIDEKGAFLQKSKWNEKVCFSTTISTNKKVTFYSQFGDYMEDYQFLAGLLLIIVFVKERLKKIKNPSNKEWVL